MIRSIAMASVLAALCTGAYAQADMPRVDRRQANQEQRIERGVASGTLTPREAGRLEAGQARVERMENRAEADGRVTRRERARLHHTQDVQSARIYRQKHDRQHDFNHNGRADRRR